MKCVWTTGPPCGAVKIQPSGPSAGKSRRWAFIASTAMRGSGTVRCERAVFGGPTYTPCLAVCWICWSPKSSPGRSPVAAPSSTRPLYRAGISSDSVRTCSTANGTIFFRGTEGSFASAHGL